MNPAQQQLWHRIQAHRLDDPESSAPFSLRLAKENDWGPEFTQRVIAEYRKFVFLAVASGHPVAPADAVDQVWHLHLLYTRDYWDEFCARVLERPLHHGPARGGVADGDKLSDWYARTLASYRTFFGEPPGEIWPAVPAHPAAVRVDPARYWIVRKPDWRGWLGLKTRNRAGQANATVPKMRAAHDRFSAVGSRGVTRAMMLTLAATLTFAAGVAPARAAAAEYGWPFDLTGPEFLTFYAAFAAVVLTVACVLRFRWRVPIDGRERENLDAYAIAQLAGGPRRAFIAALASVMNRKLVRLGKKGVVIRTDTPLPPELPLLERAICDAARLDGSRIKDVRRATNDILANNRRGLEEQGLFMLPQQRAKAHLVPFALALLVVTIGIIKIVIGVLRDRPVGILIVLTVIAGGVMIALVRRPQRSRRGDAVLRQLKEENAHTRRIRPLAIGSADAVLWVPLGVALWGAGCLHGTALQEDLNRLGPDASGSGGFSAGACGSSCGSGCGGGGGCGGCGGGS